MQAPVRTATTILLQALVVVGAAQIVSAVGADQFAAVAGELMAAGGADAAVVVDTGGFEAGIGKSIGEVGTFARA